MVIFKARVLALTFYLCHVILPSYYYSMHVEGLLLPNLCLVTLVSSE